MASSDSRALLDEQIAQLKELIAAVQCSAGAIAQIIDTDPADKRVLAQRIVDYVLVQADRLNRALDAANLLVTFQSTVVISSAHGPIPAFSAFIEMHRSMWRIFEVASNSRQTDPSNPDEIVEMVLSHWSATTVPRVENSLNVFDVWAAAKVVNQDIRERYEELTHQFHQAHALPSTPKADALLSDAAAKILNRGDDRKSSPTDDAVKHDSALNPLTGTESNSLTLFDLQSLRLQELLAAAQFAIDHIVSIMSIDRGSVGKLADSVALFAVYTNQDLGNALCEANILVSQSCKVKVEASKDPIPVIGALTALSTTIRDIARNAVPDIEFVPKNRAAVSAALQSNWMQYGVPNFGGDHAIADTRQIGLVACEHIRACHKELSDRFHQVHSGGKPLIGRSLNASASVAIATAQAGEPPAIGFLGGKELADALGVHQSRREAFNKRLERERNGLGDNCWIETGDRRPNSPQYLYRADSPKVVGLAINYKAPKGS